MDLNSYHLKNILLEQNYSIGAREKYFIETSKRKEKEKNNGLVLKPIGGPANHQKMSWAARAWASAMRGSHLRATFNITGPGRYDNLCKSASRLPADGEL